MLESGSLPSAIMYKFGASSRLVTKLKREGAAMLKEAEKNGHSSQSKSLRRGQYPEIEEMVYRFIELARSCKIPVTQITIKERSRPYTRRNSPPQRLDQCLTGTTRKLYGIYWMVRALCQAARHKVNRVAWQGASATVESAAEDMAKLRDRLREFDIGCIYNGDETGLLYKLLPKRSYVTQYENKKNAPRYSSNVGEGPYHCICLH